jgi:hypothetical protein
MKGTFNGLPLDSISSVTSETDPFGRRLSSFRVPQFPLPELEERLRLHTPARLNLHTKEIEGRIMRYTADADRGYEVTIELTRVRSMRSSA